MSCSPTPAPLAFHQASGSIVCVKPLDLMWIFRTQRSSCLRPMVVAGRRTASGQPACTCCCMFRVLQGTSCWPPWWGPHPMTLLNLAFGACTLAVMAAVPMSPVTGPNAFAKLRIWKSKSMDDGARSGPLWTCPRSAMNGRPLTASPSLCFACEGP